MQHLKLKQKIKEILLNDDLLVIKMKSDGSHGPLCSCEQCCPSADKIKYEVYDIINSLIRLYDSDTDFSNRQIYAAIKQIKNIVSELQRRELTKDNL